MFPFSFEGGFFRALFHKIFATAVVPGYIFLGLLCAASAVPKSQGVFRRNLLLRAFPALLFHAVFLHALFCWDIPVCFFAGAFCMFGFSLSAGFSRDLFEWSFSSALNRGASLGVLSGWCFFHALFLLGYPRLFLCGCFLQFSLSLLERAFSLLSFTSLLSRLYFRGTFSLHSFAGASAVPVFQGVFRRTLLLRAFSGLLFHGVFLHALFCWDIPICFLAGTFCMFAFSLLGGFFFALFRNGLLLCAILPRLFFCARLQAFFQLLFCFLRGLFSWSFPRWVFSLLLFADMASVICFPGAFSLQTFQWVFNVLSVATTFSVLSFVGFFRDLFHRGFFLGPFCRGSFRVLFCKFSPCCFRRVLCLALFNVGFLLHYFGGSPVVRWFGREFSVRSVAGYIPLPISWGLFPCCFDGGRFPCFLSWGPLPCFFSRVSFPCTF